MKQLDSLAWRRTDNRHWVCHKSGALLERQFGDSMMFCLYLSQSEQVWLQFPKLYPHEPPQIKNVISASIQNVIVTLEPATTAPIFSSMLSDTTIVYNQWSPVRRLDEFLAFLIQALKNSSTPSSSHRAALVTPTMQVEQRDDADEEMHDVSNDNNNSMSVDLHHKQWPIMPRGEIERELCNSHGY